MLYAADGPRAARTATRPPIGMRGVSKEERFRAPPLDVSSIVVAPVSTACAAAHVRSASNGAAAAAARRQVASAQPQAPRDNRRPPPRTRSRKRQPAPRRRFPIAPTRCCRVAARPRRIPRALRRLRQRRLHRRARRRLWLSRVRLNATVTPSKCAVVPGQGAGRARRARRQSARPTRAVPRAVRFCARPSPTSVTRRRRSRCALGRQELAFGEQRLLGHLSWVNTARIVGRARASPSVASRCRSTSSPPRWSAVLADEFDKSGNGNRFSGAYAHARPRGPEEPRSSRTSSGGATRTCAARLGAPRRPAPDDRSARAWPASCRRGSTTASRWRCRRGSLGADDSVQRLGRPLAAARVAAGRRARQADRRIQLRVGRREPDRRHRAAPSISSIRPATTSSGWPIRSAGGTSITCAAGFEFTPIKATPISVNYHSWWLAETTDALYAASGALVARVAGGAAGTHVGQELDVQVDAYADAAAPARRRLRAHLPGRVPKQATPGASYSYPYVMVTYVFLADR